MPPRSPLAGLVLLAACALPAPAAEPTLERRFEEVVRPFVKDQCLACHGAEMPKAKLDLSVYATVPAVVRDYRVWDLVLERLEADEMPPEKAKRHPAPHERRAVVAWIEELRAREATRNAGDPGPVLAHRLSNAEYDNTIRDLTGVDLRPTRAFPVDPANEAGFDNSGESLTMSPALLTKYLEAARSVSDHLVLTPDGLDFAPDPAVTDTDRDRYCVARIVAFYERHRVDYADYFLAAWRRRHHIGGDESGLSRRYLATVEKALAEPSPEGGPLGRVRAAWRDLPGPDRPADARRGCEALRDLVIRMRRAYAPRVGKVQVKGISPGSQPLVLWRNRQLAARRTSSPNEDDPADVKAFCRVFPDAFFVSERPPYFDAKGTLHGRLLTAGFHLMQGYFRDDRPLHELVLDDDGRRALDRLWDELNVVTGAPLRQYRDFIFFERAEPPRFMQEEGFDFARAEDKDAVSAAKLARLRAAYLAKARDNGANAEAVEAIETFFDTMSAEIRHIESARKAAEARHLDALRAFARRAYRRPLGRDEEDGLSAFYRELRARDGLNHEDAIRDSVTRILMSPHFSYRVEPAGAGEGASRVSDHVLASRLSYFLWATMPDAELLSHADRGDLHEPAVLVAQVRRMLRDPRVRGLATEFAGHWLAFRRFEEHNSVDRERFASFTNDLRRAMFEEPVRFVVDLAARDGSVLDLLDADHTFVNPVLAAHYGMPAPEVGPDDWVRIDGARRFGRGGLLPMAVFLTANSPGLRTSPVKRGYWVVRRLLGEHIPAPPPEVPELPKDEAQTGALSLPQLLARHRADRSCAGCHQRFDAVGLTFEGYGPVGERRALDLGGRPVETAATFPDGGAGDGIDGLRRYLSRRQDEFVANLSRKLLAYALGRGLIPSDDATVAALRARLAADGHRLGGLIETIATSPQFLNKRGRDDPRE